MTRLSTVSKRAALAALARMTRERGGLAVRGSELPSSTYDALLHHFGTLSRARVAAKVASPGAWRKWTRPSVLAEIRRLHAAGVAIRDRDLELIDREDLVGAIWRYFRSTPHARRRAGIPDPPRRTSEQQAWDAELVIEEILARKEAGEPLAISKAPMKLVHAALRYYGTWEDAITAAGLDYDSIRLKRRAASDAELLARLRAIARKRPRMTMNELQTHPDGPTIRSRFGSLAIALRKARLANWPVRLKHAALARDQTIARLRAWHRSGRPLSLKALTEHDVVLAHAIQRNFRSLTAAIEAARLPADPREFIQRWSKEEILRRIRAVAHAGGSLTGVAMRARDSKLFEAARRYFGSYLEAARLVGYKPPFQSWTRDKVLAEIRQLARRHGGVASSKVASRALVHASVRFFGTFAAARLAAGCSRPVR